MLSNHINALCILINAATITSAIAYTIKPIDKESFRNMESVLSSDANPDVTVSFSHFHLYVDKVDDLASYKSIENNLNDFHASLATKTTPLSIEEKKELWKTLLADDGTNHIGGIPEFKPQNRDVIRQLIAGLGFRVTGYADRLLTRTVLVSSRDPDGVQIIISATKHALYNDNAKTSRPSPDDLCDYGKSSIHADPRMHYIII
jgi:hypothetical protein